MAHVRQSIRDNAVTAVTGLSTTGSNVFRSRVYPLGTNKLPVLCVHSEAETGFISCFAEPEEVEEFLTYKRG